jgi:hypothetical protein
MSVNIPDEPQKTVNPMAAAPNDLRLETEKPPISFLAKKEIEKLFGIACLNGNLSAAQMLFETEQVELVIVGREALRLWTNAAESVKSRTESWKCVMRWLLMIIVRLGTEHLGACEKGWREMTAAWARGEFN